MLAIFAFLSIFAFAAVDQCAIGVDGVAGNSAAGFYEAMSDGKTRWNPDVSKRCAE